VLHIDFRFGYLCVFLNTNEFIILQICRICYA